MKVINLKELSKYNDFTLDMHYALDYCKENKIDKLVVEKDTYIINSDFCFQENLAISNHGYNGPKKIAVLLKNFNDFTIDFSDSILSLNSVTIPLAIINCENIKIENLSVENEAVNILCTKVTAHEKDCIICENLNDFPFTVINNKLYTPCEGRMLAPIGLNVEFNGKTSAIEKGTSDNTLGVPVDQLDFRLLENNRLQISGFKRIPPIGNVLAFNGGQRLCSGFFCENSRSINLNNINIFSSFGMGIISQLSSDITLDSFNVCRKGDAYCSVPADATHFVECTGNITVQNCLFEGMLDDALNIHGIYTKIILKTDKEIFVKEMHPESKGIKLYKAGDTVSIVNKKSLISYSEKKLVNVEYFNDDLIKLTFSESTDDIILGDSLENLSRNTADLTFKNNIVRNNRARGMLIANKGKTLIENNYFHTSGSAIRFESDGQYWFESGGIDDVLIKNNNFDNCRHGGWGEYVIECLERAAMEKDKFFHNKITVIGNKFKLLDDKAVKIDNAEEFCYYDNVFSGDENISPKISISNVNKVISKE